MVIDTSAVFAAIAPESDAKIYQTAIKSAPLLLISSVTLLRNTRLGSQSRLAEILLSLAGYGKHLAAIHAAPQETWKTWVARTLDNQWTGCAII